MYKVDLHTHSILSPDGGLTKEDYEHVLTRGILDFVAITDHNQVSFAQEMRKKWGEKIIVGEEIMTTSGEIIGLFLQERIAPKQSVADTLAAIHAQKGLVYIPHPFDMLRRGIGEKVFLQYLKDIDIIEGFNARVILPLHNAKALRFAKKHNLPIGVGSDSHVVRGIGHAYAIVDKKFTALSVKQLLSHAAYSQEYQHFFAYLAPKLNRLRKLYETK